MKNSAENNNILMQKDSFAFSFSLFELNFNYLLALIYLFLHTALLGNYSSLR